MASRSARSPFIENAGNARPERLRSRDWFDNPAKIDMVAFHLDRMLANGWPLEDLQSGKPVIGIAQSGSDIVPCNRHHVQLAERVRDGIREAGGIALEFPVHPIQETLKRPTAALDRNLQYLSLVEVLYGYPIDGVVLTTGCDKTTPAQVMAAATVDLPAIVLSGGPMLSGWYKGERVGAGTVVWKAREMLAMGQIDNEGCLEMVAASAPSAGHCNPMGTALTMNSLAEALGMSLPGCATIPAPYGERAQMAYLTGKRIVEMVREDLRPSRVLTREAFENAIVVNSALGGSTNAPWHLRAMARHAGVELDMDDWDRIGYDIPLLVNVMPAGDYLGEDFHRAGGVPAVAAELIARGKIHENTLTVNGRSLVDNCRGRFSSDRRVIKTYDDPLRPQAGFLNVKGNLFDSGIMKTSTIDEQFRTSYLSNPDDPNAFEGRAVVFDGLEDYLSRIDDEALEIDEGTLLVMRGAGPIAYPGSCEIVNMRPPKYLLEKKDWPLPWALPCIGDGRQSGTSASPSILNASPEAAAGGGLALLKTGDRVRIDLNKRTADILISDSELERRRHELQTNGGYRYPESQTPWQEIHREHVDQLSDGMVLRNAVKYQRIAATRGLPREDF